MSKLYVHIGYNKTGTTALQNFFVANRARLIERGVLYSSYGTTDVSAHHRLAAHFCRIPPVHFLEQRELSEVIDDVMNELAASTADTLLLSTEMMVFYADYYPERLKQLFARFDEVKLIAYLRRQDDYAHSYYNSALRNGRCATGFDEFIAGINLDYLDNLSAWESLFGEGNIIVRPYASELFAGDNIYADFLSQLGLVLDDKLEIPLDRPNEALSKPMVYMLRDLNHYAIQDQKQFLEYLKQFLDQHEQLPLAPEYFSRDARVSMLAKYHESNLKLAAKYGDGTPLFSDAVREDIGPVGSYDNETRELFAALIIKQWNASRTSSSRPRSLLNRLRAIVARSRR